MKFSPSFYPPYSIQINFCTGVH